MGAASVVLSAKQQSALPVRVSALPSLVAAVGASNIQRATASSKAQQGAPADVSASASLRQKRLGVRLSNHVHACGAMSQAIKSKGKNAWEPK